MTLEIIKNYEYLKEGEIWQNILFSMRRNGTPPVAGDELLLHTLTTKHMTTAREIQSIQKQHLNKQLQKVSVNNFQLKLKKKYCLHNK